MQDINVTYQTFIFINLNHYSIQKSKSKYNISLSICIHFFDKVARQGSFSRLLTDENAVAHETQKCIISTNERVYVRQGANDVLIHRYV